MIPQANRDNDLSASNASGRVGNWLAWLALLASLGYAFWLYGPSRAHYELLHNSDAMFIPVFLRGVVAHGSLSGWDLPTNPYFFPDMLLFAPLLAFVSNIYVAIVLYGVIQLGLIAVGMAWLQRQLFGPNSFADALMLLTLTLCILLIANGEQVFYPFALMSVHHTSVLVVIPFATVLLLRWLQPERSVADRKRVALILLVITLLTSLSDSLFIIQFVLPAIVASLLWGKRKKVVWWHLLLIVGSILLSAAAGQWVRQFVVSVDKLLSYTNREQEAAVSNSLGNFVNWIGIVVVEDPLLSLFWLLSVVALVGVILAALRQGIVWLRPLALVATMTLLSMIVSAVAIVVSGNFKDAFSARYLLPAIYLPLFTGVPLWIPLLLTSRQMSVPDGFGTPSFSQTFSQTRSLGITLNFLSIGAITYIFFMGRSIPITPLGPPQDAFLSCLEQETAQRQLHYGLAEYWQANYISALTQGQLQIAAATSALAPDLWNGNRHSYEQPFQFVISNPLSTPAWYIDEGYLLQKFGPPADTFRCDGNTISVYNYETNPQLRQWFAHHPDLAQLQHVGNQAEFYGYTMRSLVGAVTVGLSLGAGEEWDQDEGLLAYLPLKQLPAGSYAVAIDLYADNANAGEWEVVAITPTGRESILSEPITTTGKSVITGSFDLQEEADVDIGVKYGGRGTFFVDRVRVAHIDPAQVNSFAFTETPAPSDASTPTLRLIQPIAGTSTANGEVDFVWQWTGQPLSKEQTFEVRLWPQGGSIHYGAHDAKLSATQIRQIGDTYILRLDLSGAYSIMQQGAGDYEWTVGIVAIEPAYQDLQHEAMPYSIHVLP